MNLHEFRNSDKYLSWIEHRYRAHEDCCIWMVPQGVDVLLPLAVAVLRGLQHFVCVHMLPCGSQGHLTINCALQLCNFH